VGSEWESAGPIAFDQVEREEVYSIDTPPPTASGSLHVGHVFSYTHTDVIARYKRMCGYRCSTQWAGMTTAYPPNDVFRTITGLGVTQHFPTSKLHPTSRVATTSPPRRPISYQSRGRTSSSSASALTEEDEKAFENLWRNLGLSVDWSQTYRTISQKPSGFAACVPE
jgi:valyl-tRNA synthetase